MKKLFWGFSLLLLFSCKAEQDDFSFVFYTDVHFSSDSIAQAGFSQAIADINRQNPEFCIDGGDILFDMNHKTWEDIKGDFELYNECCDDFKMPVYHTMGNHDLLGVSEKYRDITPPAYQGKKAFGTMQDSTSYYSFCHKGWGFFVLDCIQEDDEKMLRYAIDSVQLEWISETLKKMGQDMPLVIATHVPFMTASAMYKSGPLARNSSAKVIANTKEVLHCFKGHNLKLTLSGHLHQYEKIETNQQQFVVAGAVCGFWWRGPFGTTPEGYVRVDIKGDEAKVNYLSYSH